MTAFLRCCQVWDQRSNRWLCTLVSIAFKLFVRLKAVKFQTSAITRTWKAVSVKYHSFFTVLPEYNSFSPTLPILGSKVKPLTLSMREYSIITLELMFFKSPKFIGFRIGVFLLPHRNFSSKYYSFCPMLPFQGSKVKLLIFKSGDYFFKHNTYCL